MNTVFGERRGKQDLQTVMESQNDALVQALSLKTASPASLAFPGLENPVQASSLISGHFMTFMTFSYGNV